MQKWTASRIRAAKGRQKLPCLTAYDYATARLIDEAGIPLVLVGDSLAMTVLGYETTLPVTVEEMLHHTAAVVRGVKTALVVADMPFLSYQVSVEQALSNAGRFIKEAGAGAVKIEGGALRATTIRSLVENGIPVLGHIGLTPQSIRETGGYRVEGKTAEDAGRLMADAKTIEESGVFAMVLECIPAALGAEITRRVAVPTIGIGAGRECDGQVLVTHDMLGLQTQVSPRFVKHYAELGAQMKAAFEAYREEVLGGQFPTDSHSY
jgi:3-methyl-2-oxobutanoate hydroxymethyltransferase